MLLYGDTTRLEATHPKRMAMARALRHAGLPLEGTHHRGADDAWNIAALIAQMLRDGLWR